MSINPLSIGLKSPVRNADHQIKEAVILAGGAGTRLRSVVPDLPKCMAPVAGRPFLHYVISYLIEQGIEQFIFSLGYMHEIIEQFIKDEYHMLNVQLSVEQELLGTGGAIQFACKKANAQNIIVLNGDTLYKADIFKLSSFHHQHTAACTLNLKPMHEFERYGVVETDKDGHIQSFREKQYYSEGLINGGVYALNIPSFQSLNMPEKFSFENDYLEKYFPVHKMMALVQDEYFIDIGIPEDYAKAGIDLA